MISAFAKAFAQLSDPRFRNVLVKGIGAALALYALLYLLLWLLLTETALFEIGWLEATADILGGVVVVALSLLLFPGIVGIAVSLMLDEVAGAVEARHYAKLPPPRAQSFGEAVLVALRFAGVTALFNLIALPLYLIPVVNLAVFYGVNGYLLSREYFEMIALRRLPPAEAQAMRRRYQGHLWIVGVGITFLLSVPLLNLVAPVIATAAMLHVLETLRRRPSAV